MNRKVYESIKGEFKTVAGVFVTLTKHDVKEFYNSYKEQTAQKKTSVRQGRTSC